MSHSQTPSAACCNTPPVVAKGYVSDVSQTYAQHGAHDTTEGERRVHDSRRHEDLAKHAILYIKDIFDFVPQTLQGADFLGTKYRVIMPDFFDGKPASLSWFPPDNEEKGAKLGAFFKEQGDIPKALGRAPKVLEDVTSRFPGVESWGIVGFCWYIPTA
ncbi:hypothetical protein MRB53_038420 [Persea americana]|nr:hypothetical protein MRB53_038420 [Persea americana]